MVWVHCYLSKIRVHLPRRKEKWLLAGHQWHLLPSWPDSLLGGGKLEVEAEGTILGYLGFTITPLRLQMAWFNSELRRGFLSLYFVVPRGYHKVRAAAGVMRKKAGK